jgi:hypothetical protein
MEVLADSQPDHIPWVLLRLDIDGILSDLYHVYIEALNKLYVSPCAFRSGVQIHSAVLDQIHLNQSISELHERQKTLLFTVPDASVDSLLQHLDVFFPYEFVFENLVPDLAFLNNFFQIVFRYDVSQHRAAVRAVFHLLQGKLENVHLLLIVAESLISFFVSNEIRSSERDPVRDREFLENSRFFLSAQLSKFEWKLSHLQPIAPPQTAVLAIPRHHPDYDADTQSIFRRLASQLSVSGMLSVKNRRAVPQGIWFYEAKC